MISRLCLHVPEAVAAAQGQGDAFYGPFAQGLRARGVALDFAHHDRVQALERIAADPGFHLFDFGRITHPRALNTASAYLPPFRYFDPVGVRAMSSIGAARFDPETVDPVAAAALFDRLNARFVQARASRYDQPKAFVAVPAGCIAVFLQSESHRAVGETCHLSLRQMVKAVLERDDPRPIVIKPHPRDTDFDTLGWLARKARKDARVQILPANIHDILAQADVVVTINSAVGIEAMLHRRPVILCGVADFHHICTTVRTRGAMDAALTAATDRRPDADPWPVERFLAWFYGQMCLDPTADDFLDRFLSRAAAQVADQGLL